jgi:hypothetical protein
MKISGWDTASNTWNHSPCGDLCRITGLIDHPGRVSYNELLETNLKGTLVLFTNHFQYQASDKLPTPELLSRLCGMM